MDVNKVRADFPILSRKIGDRTMVYFDNAATSQKPNVVIDALADYYQHYNANIHRGIHKLAEEATQAHEKAREKLSRFVHAKHTEEVVFVRNATEAINLVAATWGREHVKEGDRIVLTIMEHHSNIVPWQMLAREKNARVEFITVDEQGRLNGADIDHVIDGTTRVVSAAHVSNVLGTINPLKELEKKAHDVGAVFMVDAAQSVPHMPVDVVRMNCDFMAFSGHKMMGPTGIGVLYGKRDILRAMPPFMGGGEMIREVHVTGSMWKDIPYKYEAGTTNIEGAIGLGVAVDYLEKLGMHEIQQHEQEITEYAMRKMAQIPRLKIYGPEDTEARGGVISFNLGDIHAHDVASILDEEGIAIRSGHHCAQPLMEFMNVTAMARASFYAYNTKEEVDRMVAALQKAARLFKL